MTAKELLERTAARKAAGLIPDRYPVETYGPPQPPRKTAVRPEFAQNSPQIRPRLGLPCVHEGPVLEWCTTCAGERGHVRDCSHPSNPDERCTRGNRRAAVRCCLDCPDYAPAAG